jgi:hypothetical protein
MHHELGADEPHLGGRQQLAVGDRHLNSCRRACCPEIEEARAERRMQIVILPDVALQQRRMVGQAVEISAVVRPSSTER